MNSNGFDKEMDDLNFKLGIKVEHSVKFYELIGDKKELQKEGIEQFIDNSNVNEVGGGQKKKKLNKRRNVG